MAEGKVSGEVRVTATIGGLIGWGAIWIPVVRAWDPAWDEAVGLFEIDGSTLPLPVLALALGTLVAALVWLPRLPKGWSVAALTVAILQLAVWVSVAQPGELIWEGEDTNGEFLFGSVVVGPWFGFLLLVVGSLCLGFAGARHLSDRSPAPPTGD